MRRRKFIKLLGGAAVAWPIAARAQQPAMPVIGFVNGASPDGYAPMVAAFRQGLKESGYVEGQNVTIEFRWAEGHYDQLSAMIADLVRRQVSVMVANTPANLVAKAATSTIPIVFTTGTDPVQFGLVASLNRPGGNVTGVTSLTEDVAPKRLELVHELIPSATIIGFLVNPRNPNAEHLTRASQAAAAKLGLQLDVVHASSEVELGEAFTSFLQKRPGALVISADAFFNSLNEPIIKLAARYKLPVVYHERDSVAGGGLISYSGSITDSYHLAGEYVARILKGDKPSGLPVQQVTKVELAINLKTAKALGLTIPQSLLLRADEVIE
jgi:putative ABC transport system substrate-binding protein